MFIIWKFLKVQLNNIPEDKILIILELLISFYSKYLRSNFQAINFNNHKFHWKQHIFSHHFQQKAGNFRKSQNFDYLRDYFYQRKAATIPDRQQFSFKILQKRSIVTVLLITNSKKYFLLYCGLVASAAHSDSLRATVRL